MWKRHDVSQTNNNHTQKMFAEYPELVQLFPFGDDSVDHETGKLILNDRTKRHVRAHAGAVMRTVGTCVAGLTTIQDLVPRLRTVGLTHKVRFCVGCCCFHLPFLIGSCLLHHESCCTDGGRSKYALRYTLPSLNTSY